MFRFSYQARRFVEKRAGSDTWGLGAFHMGLSYLLDGQDGPWYGILITAATVETEPDSVMRSDFDLFIHILCSF